MSVIPCGKRLEKIDGLLISRSRTCASICIILCVMGQECMVSTKSLQSIPNFKEQAITHRVAQLLASDATTKTETPHVYTTETASLSSTHPETSSTKTSLTVSHTTNTPFATTASNETPSTSQDTFPTSKTTANSRVSFSEPTTESTITTTSGTAFTEHSTATISETTLTEASTGHSTVSSSKATSNTVSTDQSTASITTRAATSASTHLSTESSTVLVTAAQPSTVSSATTASATIWQASTESSTQSSAKASSNPSTVSTAQTSMAAHTSTNAESPPVTSSTEASLTSKRTMPSTSTEQVTEVTTRVNTTLSTTVNHVTVTSKPVCPDGKFGHDCAYVCRCFDEKEVCDKTTGFCSSGCLNGWSGPGCLIEARGSVPAAVVVLAFLLASFIVITCGLCVYLGAYGARKRRRQDQYAAQAGQEAYDFADMSNTAYQQPPYAALNSKVPRIRETDIKVMSDVLGEGRYGEIFRGYLTTQRNMPVAFKTIKPDATEFEKSGFINHLELHSSLEPNPNVIRFHGACLVGDQIYAAFEYAPRDNLRNFLRTQAIKDKEELDEAEVLTRERLLEFAFDVAAGMNYLANKQIVHRELMTRHVLVCDGYVAKVSGIYSHKTPIQQLHVRWLAPEAIQYGQYSVESDIWSFGVVMWEIMTYGDKPYPGKATKDLPEELGRGYRMNQPKNCEDSVYQLMQWCWHAEADQRPAFPLLVDALRDLIENGKIQVGSLRRIIRSHGDLSEEEPLD